MNITALCLPLSLRRRHVALPVFLTLLLPSLTHAATLTVPAQYTTIQAAINASQNGDTVLIADGTYSGAGNRDLDFGGRNITVTSQNGPASTIIDCGGSSAANHRGFYIHSGETGAVISGLTIKNGYESGYSNGGGVLTGGTGAVTLVITNCSLTGNYANDGGGIYNLVGTVNLNACTIAGNNANKDGGGGYNSGIMTLTNCTFIGNSAKSRGNNFLNGYVVTTSLTNCTLIGNTTNSSGGNVNSSLSRGTITLTNDIIYGDNGNEVIGSGVTANYCDIQGGYAGTGNINADPLFVNPAANDFHLKAGSPCLGAGTANGAPSIDADGNVRPNPPSIGAYEGVPVPPQTSVTGTASLQGWMGTPQTLTCTLIPTGTTTGGVLTLTVTPAANGSFTVTNVPAGTYTLGVKGSRWLRKDMAVDTTGGDLSGLSVSLPGGDVNGDDVVNGLDISMISAAFRTHPGDAKWNVACDVNGDGVVNGLDLSIASANFRKRSDP